MNDPTGTPNPAIEAALRPLTGLVGRGSELGRLLGHLDARRSVRLEAARGAGATALLRALCAEPARPAAPDGTIALPVGLPVDDMSVVAQALTPASSTPVAQRRMLVLVDDREMSGADIAVLAEQLPRSLLVVTGEPNAAVDGLAPVAVPGLSQHHAVGLVEAAMGRALSIEEGRAARAVATAVDGMPAPLVQAAAAVREGGLTFDDVLDLLDDPPRPTALTVSLQHALSDDLHVTLSHLRAMGDTPASTRVVAAACGLDRAEASHRLRRLAVLGMAFTDGRDGWTAASGIPAVSEPVRAGAAGKVAEWLGETGTALDMFDLATVLSVTADRRTADDRPATLALARDTLERLPLDGLSATTLLLERATAWALPDPALTADVDSAATPTGETDGEVDESAHLHDGPADGEDAGQGAEPGPEQQMEPDAGPDTVSDAAPAVSSVVEPGEPDDAGAAPSASSANPVLALLGDRRRLAVIAVAAAAVIAAVLLVVPSLRDEPTATVIRGDVDLGVASVGETASGTLALDLSATAAAMPVALVVDGPDADAFTLDPTRCDGLDCRTSVTFTPDRAGIHLATVRAVDADDEPVAVAELTGSGTGDPPDATVSTNLAVTLFPSRPTPIVGGESAVVPVGVRNNGPDDSTGSRLVVTVPERVTADAPGCTFEAPTLTCPLAELPAATSERVAVTLTVPRRADSVRVNAVVAPLADSDDAEGDNAAGFTYRVVAPDDQG